MLKFFINGLYRTRFLIRLYGRVFHSFDYYFLREIKECSSVLDLGCGPSSPLQNCKKDIYSVAVDAYLPYIKESKRQKIHDKYIHKRIKEVDFSPRSFDAVILIEVLEHLSKKLGLKILKKAEKWAKKKVIVTTPNGFWHQRNYHVSGLSGCKFLRKESENDTMKNDLLSLVRFLRRILERKQVAIKTLNSGQVLADETFLKPLNYFRRRFLWLGQTQLILARKRT